MKETREVPLRERIILALDVEDGDAAMALVKRTEGAIGFYKVGLELFLAEGFSMVDRLVDRGHKVMLDLKFFDIPETVGRAVARLSGRGVTFATVHGNDAILEAAIAARNEVRILAVTVLTSFGESDLAAMGMTRPVADLVRFRAARALEMGCDGVVCSGLEADDLRRELGPGLILVTPGIRPGANRMAADDQTRIITPAAAVRRGADHLVVGRPISRAPDPLAAARAMLAEIAAVTGE
jgi:orotidine-5'-phosphate decarboxylase